MNKKVIIAIVVIAAALLLMKQFEVGPFRTDAQEKAGDPWTDY